MPRHSHPARPCRSTQPKIWDPSTLSFERTGTLASSRFGHAAVLLQDGRVLVVGAWHGLGNPRAEVFTLR